METQDCYGLPNKCFSYQGWTVIGHIQRSEPARAAFNPALNFPRYIQKVVFSFFIDGTLKQSDQRCYFLSCDGGVKWRDGVIEGGKIWDPEEEEEEEEEDKKRESRTETWLTVTAFWVVCSRALSCVGPDGEVLLSSSVNTVCYQPIQPIQHRCPGVTDRELSFLTSNDDFSSSRALQAWLDAVKTDLLCFCWLLIEDNWKDGIKDFLHKSFWSNKSSRDELKTLWFIFSEKYWNTMFVSFMYGPGFAVPGQHRKFKHTSCSHLTLLTFALPKGMRNKITWWLFINREHISSTTKQLWIIWWIALFAVTMEPSFDKLFPVLIWTVKTSLTIHDQQKSNWRSFWSSIVFFFKIINSEKTSIVLWVQP